MFTCGHVMREIFFIADDVGGLGPLYTVTPGQEVLGGVRKQTEEPWRQS